MCRHHLTVSIARTSCRHHHPRFYCFLRHQVTVVDHTCSLSSSSWHPTTLITLSELSSHCQHLLAHPRRHHAHCHHHRGTRPRSSHRWSCRLTVSAYSLILAVITVDPTSTISSCHHQVSVCARCHHHCHRDIVVPSHAHHTVVLVCRCFLTLSVTHLSSSSSPLSPPPALLRVITQCPCVLAVVIMTLWHPAMLITASTLLSHRQRYSSSLSSPLPPTSTTFSCHHPVSVRARGRHRDIVMATLITPSSPLPPPPQLLRVVTKLPLCMRVRDLSECGCGWTGHGHGRTHHTHVRSSATDSLAPPRQDDDNGSTTDMQ